MRFTPSDKFLMYTRSAAKTVRWKAYFRLVTALNTALDAAPAWTDASDHLTEVPDFASMIEHDICQFSTDSINVVGKGIDWWEDNFFTLASESDYVECKFIFELGSHPDWCTDVVVEASGFVDHVRRKKQESTDSVSFAVYTAQDMGDRIPAEVLTVQPINPDIDGLGTDGLTIGELPRLYIKDAAISGKELVVGSHTLAYQYNSGSPIARLDDGEYVTLADGENTVYNADESQALVLYTVDVDQLPRGSGEVLVYVVVLTQGETLPKVWPRFVSVKTMLKNIHALIGIDTITWGSLEYPTWDGNAKVSFVDQPPEDNSFAYRWALATDGTDLWVGVGNKLYVRTMSTGVYTLKATLTSGYIISRIWYDSSGYIWVYAQESLTNTAGHVLRHTIATAANSSEVALTGSTKYAIEFLSGRGIVYVDMTNHAVREVPSSTMTDALVFANTDMGYTGTGGPDGNFCFVRSGSFWVQTSDLSGSYYHRIYYAAGWNDEGQVLTLTAGYQVGGFHASEDRVYYADVVNLRIASHTVSSATVTAVLSLEQADTLVTSMHYANTRVYFTTPNGGKLYSLASNAATVLNEVVRTHTAYHGFAYIDRLYGLDEAGRIYQYHTTSALYIKNARFDGETVTGALRKILASFMLAGNIRSTKQAFIYPRTNDSGDLVSTGQTLTITEDEACEVEEEREYVSAADLVDVANSETRWTYDGTNWNSLALSTARTVTISSDLIPSEIVRDMCYRAWQFFKNAHHMVTVTLTAQPYFQYEPFDGCSLSISGTKIPLSTTGVIYRTLATREGSATFGVLV